MYAAHRGAKAVQRHVASARLVGATQAQPSSENRSAAFPSGAWALRKGVSR